MRSKEDHIDYWKSTANDSWSTAEYLHQGKRHPEALFLYCLAIEKWLKAVWVKHNINNFPPRIHDLNSLYSETNLELPAELIDYLSVVNRWNLEGRYPDYRFSLKKMATQSYMEQQLEKLKALKTCLQKEL